MIPRRLVSWCVAVLCMAPIAALAGPVNGTTRPCKLDASGQTCVSASNDSFGVGGQTQSPVAAGSPGQPGQGGAETAAPGGGGSARAAGAGGGGRPPHDSDCSPVRPDLFGELPVRCSGALQCGCQHV